MPSFIQNTLEQVHNQLVAGDLYQPDFSGVDPAMLNFAADLMPGLQEDKLPFRRVRSASDMAHTTSEGHSNSPEAVRMPRSRSMSNSGQTDVCYTLMQKEIQTWAFNVFQILDEYPDILLSVMCAACHEHDLINKLGLSNGKLRALFALIESSYNQANPYHNAYHAADVVITLNNFYRHGLIKKASLSNIEIFAGLLAASIHDFGHPGVNGNFLIMTGSDLALIYNDQSVLENYHLHSFFRALREDEHNALSALSKADQKQIRDLAIKMVLATDMTEHFRYYGKFSNKIQTIEPARKKSDKFLVMQMALKCADIGNPAKDIDQSVAWTSLVVNEFWEQGDMEKKLNLDVSAGMDRSIHNVAAGQVGFIEFFVHPIFKAWGEYLGTDMYIDHISQTKNHWDKMSEEEATTLVERTISDLGIVTRSPKVIKMGLERVESMELPLSLTVTDVV